MVASPGSSLSLLPLLLLQVVVAKDVTDVTLQSIVRSTLMALV